VTEPAALTPEEALLLQRRMAALNDGDLVLRDWDMTFIQSICWKQPETLTPRQREMVELLAWRYRAQIPAALAPTREPKLSPRPERPDRSFEPGPKHRKRGPRA
jgi:hypothetical protein